MNRFASVRGRKTGSKEKSKRQRPNIILPDGYHPSKFAGSADNKNIIILCAPLTVTQNVWQRWHPFERIKFRDLCIPILRDQINHVLGGGYPRPHFLGFVELSIIRCSNATNATDDDGEEGGVKPVRDLLCMPRLKPKYKNERPGFGVIQDDNKRFLKVVSREDRPLGHWEKLPGPATWLFLRTKE